MEPIQKLKTVFENYKDNTDIFSRKINEVIDRLNYLTANREKPCDCPDGYRDCPACGKKKEEHALITKARIDTAEDILNGVAELIKSEISRLNQQLTNLK